MPSKSPEVSVEPSLLSWARESYGISLMDVAKKLKTDETLIEKWEAGQAHLTLSKLEKLSHLYKRPLAVFFLPSPPVEPALPTDFRTLTRDRKNSLSVKTRLAIRRARRLQELAIDLSKNLGRGVSFQLPMLNYSDDPENAAATFRQKIGIDFEMQLKWKDETHALEAWRTILEGLGMLILQASMPLNDVRGFSFAEGANPTVVLNTKDSPAGRIFTMFHEVAHLLLRKGGICDLESSSTSGDEIQKVEQFCNHFSGAFLAPKQYLLSVTHATQSTREWSEETLMKLSASFKVSQEVILRRLMILGLTSQKFYQHKRNEWLEKARLRKKRSGFAPPPAKKCIRDNGPAFVKLAFENYRSEKITDVDLADYLGIRLKHLPRVSAILEEQV